MDSGLGQGGVVHWRQDGRAGKWVEYDELRLTIDYLRDGLSIEDAIEAHFVPIDSEEEEDEDEDEEDESMDVDVDVKEEEEDITPRVFEYRHQSPDMSWLPPMPSDQVQTVSTGTGAVGVAADAIPAPQSVADRYRRPVAYASSQLAERGFDFADPPKSMTRSHLPAAPTSFPSLLNTYEAVKSEPSVALRQTDGRRQAADLLRLTVGNPEVFSPKDTLFSSLPPPRVSPIVPSHSETLPPRFLPINPDREGIVSSLLFEIRSPYLPPPLRERLTSLRPPQVQTPENGAPFLYGEPVRGADEAALAKARGKATGEEQEAWFRATWDSGSRGSEKWSNGRLPTGKKVIRMVEGEMKPRESEGAKALRIKMNEKAAGVVEAKQGSPPAASPAVGIKIRLGGKPSGDVAMS